MAAVRMRNITSLESSGFRCCVLTYLNYLILLYQRPRLFGGILQSHRGWKGRQGVIESSLPAKPGNVLMAAESVL